MLKAGAEVSDALVTYEKAKSKEATRQLQIESLQKALDFSSELLTYSSKVNYVNVLTAEQALLQAQLSAVNDKLQQLQAMTEFVFDDIACIVANEGLRFVFSSFG